jgi:tetratricopeptide (TPR) repeat protein
VVRILFASCFLTCLLAGRQQPAPHQESQAPAAKQEEQEPPEEDESLQPKEYAFNPLEAARNVTAGNFYFKKGNYRAAAKRYLEATRWDPTSAEAFFKLGEASEKRKDHDAAREAYSKYLELAPDAKNAGEIKKKIAKWPAPSAKK